MTLAAAALGIALPILIAALVLAVYRVLVGPSLPDRVVALELMTTIAVGLLAVAAAATDRSEYLDVAVVLVLVSFVGAVGFASYLQRGR